MPAPLESLTGASALESSEIGLGTVVVKNLTAADIATGQILLPSPAVEQHIPAALEHAVLKFEVGQQLTAG